MHNYTTCVCVCVCVCLFVCVLCVCVCVCMFRACVQVVCAQRYIIPVCTTTEHALMIYPLHTPMIHTRTTSFPIKTRTPSLAMSFERVSYCSGTENRTIDLCLGMYRDIPCTERHLQHGLVHVFWVEKISQSSVETKNPVPYNFVMGLCALCFTSVP